MFLNSLLFSTTLYAFVYMSDVVICQRECLQNKLNSWTSSIMYQDVFTSRDAPHCWDSYARNQRYHAVYSLHGPCGFMGKGVVSEKVSDASIVCVIRMSSICIFLSCCVSFESFNIHSDISTNNPAESKATIIWFRGK